MSYSIAAVSLELLLLLVLLLVLALVLVLVLMLVLVLVLVLGSPAMCFLKKSGERVRVSYSIAAVSLELLG